MGSRTQEFTSNELSPIENKCFSATTETVSSTLKKLTQEDQLVCNQRTKYTEQLDTEQCLFCHLHTDKKRIIKEFEHCFVIADKFPVSKGHILIISKEHTPDWFSANPSTLSNIVFALTEMKNLLTKKYNPQGYNIGANCGKAAGQTIMHLHVHLIPRYFNDTEDPRGGIRGVIPAKQQY